MWTTDKIAFCQNNLLCVLLNIYDLLAQLIMHARCRPLYAGRFFGQHHDIGLVWSPSTDVFCVAFPTTNNLSPGSKLFCSSSKFVSGPKEGIGWLVICLFSICIGFDSSCQTSRLTPFLTFWGLGCKIFASEELVHDCYFCFLYWERGLLGLG